LLWAFEEVNALLSSIIGLSAIQHTSYFCHAEFVSASPAPLIWTFEARISQVVQEVWIFESVDVLKPKLKTISKVHTSNLY
jgi:hypothetical protein